MAQDKVTYRPLSFKETLATLQPVDKPTTSPQELKYVAVSKDPEAPKIAFKKDATQEEINAYLKSELAEKALANKGYLYKFGLAAEKFNDEEDLDDTALTKGLKAGYAGLKQIGAGAVATIADAIGAEDMQAKMDKAIAQYQLQGQAQQFIKTDDGRIIPFETSLEKIYESEEQFANFTKWLAFNIGNGAATSIPILAASLIPGIGTGLAVSMAYGMGVGDARISQLEAVDDPNAALSLALGVPYAAAEYVLGAGSTLAKTIKNVIGKETAKKATNSTIKTIGKEFASTTVKEGLAEGIQEAIVETGKAIETGMKPGENIKEQISLLYNDPDFYKKLVESTAAGAAGGGPFGIVGGTVKSFKINQEAKAIQKFDGTFDEGTLDTENENVKDFVGKTVTVVGDYTVTNADDEVIVDKNGEPITPKYTVNGVAKVNGVDSIILTSTIDGTKEPVISIPIQDKSALIEDVEVKEETKAPVNEQAQTEEIQPKEDVEEFVKHNQNTVKKSERILKQRGYSDKEIKDIRKKAGVNADDDIVTLATDEVNYISKNEREKLEKLGYMKGDNGIAYINSLEEDVSVDKDDKGKTRGRKTIEEILRTKKQFEPVRETFTVQGEQVITPPLTGDELIKAGYSLGYIEGLTEQEYTNNINTLDQQINTTENPEQKQQAIERKRNLISAYKLKDTTATDRLNRLEGMAKNKGLFAPLVGGQTVPISKIPATIRGITEQIDRASNNRFITAEERAQQLADLSRQLEEANQIKSDFQQLLITLGQDTMPDSELIKMTPTNKVIKEIKKNVKGTVTTKRQKVIEEYYSLRKGRAGLTAKFANDIPTVTARLLQELKRLGLNNINLKIVENYVRNGYELNGSYMVDDRLITVAMNAERDIAGFEQDPRLFTLHHEVMHALFRDGFFTPQEKKMLFDYAKKYWRKSLRTDEVYKGASEEVLNEEAVSDLFAAYMAGQYKPRGAINIMFDRLKQFLRALQRALFDTGYTTPTDVFKAIDLGIIQERRARQERQQADIRNVANAATLTKLNSNAFKRWFGKSKIVDETGAPRVLYHGSTATFKQFKPGADGLIHVGTAGQADTILAQKAEYQKDLVGDYVQGSNVVPVLVSMQNPLRMADQNWSPLKILSALTKTTLESPYTKLFSIDEAANLSRQLYRILEVNKGLRTTDPKFQKLGNEIITKAIKQKGYDGIVYQNEFEVDYTLDEGPQDSYIVFDPVQIKGVSNSGDYNVGNPNFMASVKYETDPSDKPIDQPVEPNRETTRKETRQMENQIKQDTTFTQGGTVSPSKLGIFSKVMSHARIWAKKYPVFTPLYSLVQNKQSKARELQTQFVDVLSETFIPAMKNDGVRLQMEKAFEISQQVPGRYRRNQNGEIIFVAQENGRGANSTVKKGDIIILRGDSAKAYEDVQKALGIQHQEIVKGMLANENVSSLITEAIEFLKDKRPDLADNPIFALTPEQYENLGIAELRFLISELSNPATLLQPDGAFDPANFAKVTSIVNRKSTNEEKNIVVDSGLQSILNELNTYEKFKQNDYIPLQRYGDYYITVKDADGNLLDYRQFNKGKFYNKILNEEPEVRAELNRKYPDAIISDTNKVSISTFRKELGADFAALDSVAQHLSDISANAYVEMRKELDRMVNREYGADIKGYSLFLRPRKEQAGVPGFSTDFVRAISQYGSTSSEFAARNRYSSSINRAYKAVKDPEINRDENLREAAVKWYDYVNDPKQEFAQIRRLGFWWYLGGNISSALLQVMSNIQFTGPILSQFSNTPLAVKELGRAFNDVRKMLTFGGQKYQDVFLDFTKLPADVRDDAIKDINNGLIKQGQALREAGMPTGSAVMRERSRFRNGFRTFENTVIGGMFNTMETTSRLVAYIATHRLAQRSDFRKKADEFYSSDAQYNYNVNANDGIVTPRILAQQIIEETFGVYGKENRPQIMRGFGSTIFLFQTYISQMFSLMWRMLTSGPRNKRLTGQKIFARMMLMILATGGLAGLPGADDAAWLYDTMRKMITGLERDTRQEFRTMMNEFGFGAKAIEALENGLINAYMNVDVQRRLSLGTAPGSGQFRAIIGMMGINTGARAEEFLGAPGAILFQNARNLLTQYQAGTADLMDVLSAVTPTFVKNFVKGFNYGVSGKAYSNYGTLMTDDLNALDALYQSIGFTPTKISKEREALRLERLTGGATSMVRQRFNNRIKEAFRKMLVANQENDAKNQIQAQEDLAEIMQDLYKFNGNQEAIYQINPDLYRLLQEAMKDISPLYRLSSTQALQMVKNLYDRQLLGLE